MFRVLRAVHRSLGLCSDSSKMEEVVQGHRLRVLLQEAVTTVCACGSEEKGGSDPEAVCRAALHEAHLQADIGDPIVAKVFLRAKKEYRCHRGIPPSEYTNKVAKPWSHKRPCRRILQEGGSNTFF